MLIGMTVYTCQYWADQRKLSKEQLAAHIVNLAWYGLSRMEAKPELRYESEKAAREAEKYENPIPSRELILHHLSERGSPAAREELVAEFGLTTDEQLEALRRRLRAM